MTAELREAVRGSDAVVLGVVHDLRSADPTGVATSNHDADWWLATIDVEEVVKGENVGPTLEVVYANSTDVMWFRAPKPTEGQRGVFLLRRAERGFGLLDPAGIQPPENIDEVRA